MALFFVGKFEARGMAGNAMALVSSVFFAMLILALRREHDASRAAVTWGNVAIALVLLPFVANDLALSLRSFLVLLFLGVFQIGLAYAFFVKGLRYVTATQASLTGMLEPVANPIWVLLFLGERPSAYAIAGGGDRALAAMRPGTRQGEPVANAVCRYCCSSAATVDVRHRRRGRLLAAIAWHTMQGEPATDKPAPD